MERKYVAFISYRHAELDSAVAKQVHTLIEKYVIPKKLRKEGKKLGIVFRDQEELPVSSDLSGDICRALDNAQYLIVICTENTGKSPWVGREIEYFLSHHSRNNALAVLAQGEPVDVFPRGLTHFAEPDGSVTEIEPLAIDVRADSIPAMKKKMKREITRLYAALIGCPYDALVLREQRRKRRQLAAVMAVILAVVTSFSAVTLVKNHEIDQKNEELAGMNLTLEDKNQELEDKNDELARQKAEVQLRESELLTEKGFVGIDSGDTQSALENFLLALPTPEEDRPYYAPAERGLTKALGIYDEEKEDYKVFNTTISQSTPIAAYEISPDGTRIMTLDNYGVVTCYDTETAQTLWTSQINDSSYAENMQMIPLPEKNMVLVYISFTIAAIEWEQGQTLWTYTTESTTKMYISPDHRVVGCRIKRLTDTFTETENGYEFLWTDTGEAICTIELGTSAFLSEDDTYPDWRFPDDLSKDSQNGAFSTDGMRFVTTYMEHIGEESKHIHYVLLDLQAGTSRELYSREQPDFYSQEEVAVLSFAEDDTALLSVIDMQSSSYGAKVEKLDIQTGQPSWLISTPVEGETYPFSSQEPVLTILGKEHLYLWKGKYLYILRLSDGEINYRMNCTEKAVALETVEDIFFGVVFESGRYTLGWANQTGIYLADQYYGQPLSLGQTNEVKFWNEGMLRFVVENNSIQQMQIGTQQAPLGFAVVRPANSEQSVVIKRTVYFGDVLQTEPVDLLEEKKYLVNGAIYRIGEDRLAVGRFSDSRNETNKYSYKVIDLNTHKVETEYVLQEFVIESYTRFLSEDTGYVTFNPTDGIYYYDGEGACTALTKNVEVSFPDAPQESYYREVYSAERQEKDGKLLIVSLEEDRLTYWLDGKEKQEVTIPEEITPQLIRGNKRHCLMSAGRNGMILVGNYGDGEDNYIDNFAVYDIHTGAWHTVASGRDTSNGFVGTGQTKPWLLLNDASNNVFVYDVETDALLYQFPLQLPMNSVSQICLTAKDRYVVVKTIDMQVFLWDIETGQTVYTQQIEGYAGGIVHVGVDETNHRLYLWDDSDYKKAGYCLDMESWTELARIPGLLYYDEARNEVYCYDGYTDNFQAFRAMSLEELITAGKALTA